MDWKGSFGGDQIVVLAREEGQVVEETLLQIEKIHEDTSITHIVLCQPDLFMNDDIAHAILDVIVTTFFQDGRQWEELALMSNTNAWTDENGNLDMVAFAMPGIVQSTRMSWFKQQLTSRLGVGSGRLEEKQPECGIAASGACRTIVQRDMLSLNLLETDSNEAAGNAEEEAEDVVANSGYETEPLTDDDTATPPDNEKKYKMTFKYNRDRHVIEADPDASFLDIKKMLEDATAVPADEQELIFEGLSFKIKDDKTPNYYHFASGGYYIMKRRENN